MNEIRYGERIFREPDLIIGAGTCTILHSMNGESLAMDTLNFKIFNINVNDVSEFDKTDSLFLYIDGRFVGKFFASEIKKIGAGIFSFSCESAVSKLENGMHYGGMYNGESLNIVLNEILEGIPHSYDGSVSDLKVYGWLPYDTKRNNLQQLTLATGLAIKTLSNGNLHVTALSNNFAGVFGANRVGVGGNVIETDPYTAVVVTEHTYAEVEDPVTLFEDTFFGEQTITFSEPAHDLFITGGTIISSSANHAIVNGAGTVVLTGKKYLHTTREVTAGSSLENVVPVKDLTIANILNSLDIAERIYNLYLSNRAIEADVLYAAERPGDLVSVINPYTFETESGYIQNMNISMSNLAKARARILLDFTPMAPSSGYQNRTVITESGNFVIPAGVTRMRAILISGGQGGQGGYDGEDGGEARFVWGDNDTIYDGGIGGTRGTCGMPGDPGKVLNITMDVTPGQTLAAAIGEGGIGGLNGALGQLGGATTLGTYSSDNGAVPDRGYVDIFTSEAYALTGTVGKDGANGGAGSRQSTGADGANTDTAQGGDGGSYLHKSDDDAGGGGGGGAANFKDGEDGTDAAYDPSYSGSRKGRMVSGDGGSGASPDSPADASVAGKGGDGGHGGGGGGGAGGYIYDDNDREYSHTEGNPGLGGTGSRGGRGGPGLIIIYY